MVSLETSREAEVETEERKTTHITNVLGNDKCLLKMRTGSGEIAVYHLCYGQIVEHNPCPTLVPGRLKQRQRLGIIGTRSRRVRMQGDGSHGEGHARNVGITARARQLHRLVGVLEYDWIKVTLTECSEDYGAEQVSGQPRVPYSASDDETFLGSQATLGP
jgi:hypothetical protein